MMTTKDKRIDGAMRSLLSDDHDWDFMEWEEELRGGRVIVWDTVSRRVSYFRFFVDDHGWRECPDEWIFEYGQKHADLLQFFKDVSYGILA